MVEEIWREIEGYEGRYWVSNNGRVKNAEGHIMKQNLNNSGYMQAPLFKEKKLKRKNTHRLVAKAFLPVKNNEKLEVNHKDGDKTNNSAENLEWVTKRQNSLHRIYVLGKSPIQPKKVRCVETGEIYSSISIATKKAKLKNPISISYAVNGKAKTAGGYHWEYI